MGLGIVFALLSVVMTSLTNTLQEYIADRFPVSVSLVVQYTFLVIFAALGVLFLDSFVLSEPSLKFISLLGLTGLIGYLGIRLLFKALSKLDVAVVMMIAFAYVFFSYFLNIYLFPTIEQVTPLTMVLAVAFFGVVSTLLFQKNSQSSGFHLNKRLLLPLGTALCRSIFFAFINYFIKEDFLSPYQSVFYTEGVIFVVALIQYLFTHRNFKPIQALPLRSVFNYAMWGFGAFTMGLLTYYAYQYAPANIVNIVKLSSIILTALFGWLFLKEKLTPRQIALMCIAIIILGLFIAIS